MSISKNMIFTSVCSENGNLVLDSWLVSFHPNNNWKCICCLLRLQQTTASHQNQRVCYFTGIGGLLCRDERCSTNVLLNPIILDIFW